MLARRSLGERVLGASCWVLGAVLRAGCLVPCAMCLVLSHARVGQRAIGVEADVGIERRIERLDALQMRLDEFDGGDLPRAHEPRQFGGGSKYRNRHFAQSI